jgi:hypothetical protein
MVVTWHPDDVSSTLRTGSRAIAPALLYADKVNIWSLESDDALEAADYFELQDVSEEIVQFDSLDTTYEMPNGDVEWGYEAPSELVVQWHVEEIAKVAPKDVERLWQHLKPIAEIDKSAAKDIVRRTVRGRMASALSRRLEDIDDREDNLFLCRSGAGAEVLLANHILQTENRVGLLDDMRGNISAASNQFGRDHMAALTEVLNAEGSMGVGAIQRLPSIRQIEWSEVWDVRTQLQAPMRRFRSATMKLVEGRSEHPLDKEFADFVEIKWRSEIAPAIEEIEELVREKSFRQLFFYDSLGHLETYAGPGIGLGVAQALDVALWLGGAVGAASAACGRAVADYIKSRREIASHDFFFLYEVERRAAGPFPEWNAP